MSSSQSASDSAAPSSPGPASPSRKSSYPLLEEHHPSGSGGGGSGRTSTPSPPPPRARLNSHPSDIPRTYSGLYGTGGEAGDLLPFELTRNRNTDWVDTAAPFLLITYLFIIAAFELCVLVIGGVPFGPSWTVTNVGHFLVTMTYLHWIKGSPNFYEQGEMNAMTTWEQLDASQVPRDNQKRALFIVPTILCHVACHFAEYDKALSLVNVAVWSVCIVAKLSFMNGVRILGINRTTGIDDDLRKRD